LESGEDSHSGALSEIADLFVKIVSNICLDASRSSFKDAFISEFFSVPDIHENWFSSYNAFDLDLSFSWGDLEVILAFDVKGVKRAFRIYIAEEVIILPKSYNTMSSVFEGLDSGELEIRSLFDEVELFDVSTGVSIYICKEISTERYIEFKKEKVY
jgi:hypothetical protein|tara:strand:+ start:707 stop:1177 length:471 start_codon:yes stop_codon:yes gene_type:complete